MSNLTDDNEIRTVLDGSDNRRRVYLGNTLLGWITTWHERDQSNETGIKRFSAAPIGLSVTRHNCETFSSAVAYLRGYLDI